MLFKTNITALRKVRNALALNQKMNNMATQVILSDASKAKVKQAVKLIEQADAILQEIK